MKKEPIRQKHTDSAGTIPVQYIETIWVYVRPAGTALEQNDGHSIQQIQVHLRGGYPIHAGPQPGPSLERGVPDRRGGVSQLRDVTRPRATGRPRCRHGPGHALHGSARLLWRPFGRCAPRTPGEPSLVLPGVHLPFNPGTSAAGAACRHRSSMESRFEGRPARGKVEGGATFDWLIVGGGIHGVHLATRLLQEGGLDPGRLCIVDPAPRQLSRWRTQTSRVGMTHLRSPVMHHLDTEPYSLAEFASERGRGSSRDFLPPNDRPSLELFNDHCQSVIDRYCLARRHLRGTVREVGMGSSGVLVRLAEGNRLHADRLILAIGAGDHLAWPSWAPRRHPALRHVLDERNPDYRGRTGPVAVVGGGISAGQLALRFAGQSRQVYLLSRHSPRTRQYDANPGWFGPKYMRGFARTVDYELRRELIVDGRNRGSMTPEVRSALEAAVEQGRVTECRQGVRALATSGGQLLLQLSDGASIPVDEVVLATGVSPRRPGGAMLDGLISQLSLPCAPCGYPIVDEALRWHPRIHVSGPLAELELGPVARNIAGAQRAGDRILPTLAPALCS